ncbi:hypothetical protein AB0I60_21605 [Actinosynnema sp. NPDC050436]|uniref:hypothetical protein n=1 Tax=Actinosynnema sp. NPDC050436 TaxID=3155659 RepID=UPI0033CE4060
MSVDHAAHHGGTATTRPRRRVAMIAAGALFTAAMTSAVSTGTAQAEQRCGANPYVHNITVTQGPGPDFTIKLKPTEAARNATLNRKAWDATVSMWHAVQGCVPGLYHQLADSVWQQLECHVYYGRANDLTGPTFDFESWHAPLPDPNWLNYGTSKCLNTQTNHWKGTGKLIPGALDLHGVNSNIG